MSHHASGQNYLLCKSTDLRNDFTVVYDFVLTHFSKSESIQNLISPALLTLGLLIYVNTTTFL